MQAVVRRASSVLVLSFAAAAALQAQTPQTTTEVPRVIRVDGALRAGSASTARVEAVTFAIYSEETGGAPLWQETQYVTVNGDGQYSALLGSTEAGGLPLGVFTSSDARWLGIHVERPGEVDAPRMRITSVPYALRASDADTLGGRPASAYLLADPDNRGRTTGSVRIDAKTLAGGAATQTFGALNAIGKFVTATDLGSSALWDTGGFIGVNTASPFDALHVRFTDTSGAFTGYAVQNLGATATSYSGMLFYDQNGTLGQFQGFNNVTHEYRINNIASGGAINFMIGGGSKMRVANNGDIQFGSATLHSPNPQSIGLGVSSLAGGTGLYNTAMGFQAMTLNSSGSFNSGFGAFALQGTSTGNTNTALGYAAGYRNDTGSSNIAVGYFAGSNPDVGNSNNIHIGSGGLSSDNGVIRIGANPAQGAFFAAGIRGVTTGIANAVTVMIDSNGQLGTINSSRRYKEDIQDMGDASSGLMKLRPVTYRYKQPYADGRKPIDYGLIAEEVEQVYPDLVAHLADGQVETVQYQKINAMLLNEVQKQHAALELQRAEIAALKARLDALEHPKP
jgi:Chaperone of endosialidase